MKTLSMEDLLSNSSYDLELEKIKNKINTLYLNMITKIFKASNPGASEISLQEFLEENKIEFGETETFQEEADELESMLDKLLNSGELDSVVDRDYQTPSVESGKELKNKTHDVPKDFKTKPLPVPSEGLFSIKETRTLPKTKSLKTPTGTIKRVSTDMPKVTKKSLAVVWDAERQKLLDLVKKRNKEYGVIL